MGRNRRRHGNRCWEGEKEGPAVADGHPFRNSGHRNSPRTPPTNSPPSMHPDYNPFQSRNIETNPKLRPNRAKGSSQHQHRNPHPTTTQRLAARDRALFQADWKLRQRHLKKHLVQTLNLAVQTIELWLPETASFEDAYETDTGSDTSDDTVDEMEWQHEKEIVIDVDPSLTPRRHGAEQAGFNMTPPYTPANLVPRACGQLLQGDGWSP
jgi:hypothetical protein